MITDPDGNHIAFAEAIDPSMARWRRTIQRRTQPLATHVSPL